LIVAVMARRWRRVPLALVVLGIVGYAAGGALAAGALVHEDDGGAAQTASGKRHGPNVLVVLIDTLRADHLGCYGYTPPTSRATAAFAGEGVQFGHPYPQSTWTKPATASIMTGRYPRQHQAYLEKSKLPESELLLPEALHAAGYRTGVFSGNPWVTPEWGFDQ